MSQELALEDRALIDGIVHDLETAWNTGDGAAFGAHFAADADFVNIQADHIQGREAIAGGHSAIFRTIYAGSINQYMVEAARLLAPQVALVHVRSVLDSPTGPLSGRHSARFSLVLVRQSAGWQIAAFHNTLVPERNTA